MILPQTTAFATLRNRLNSVSFVGLAASPATTARGSSSTITLRAKDSAKKDEVNWTELLSKFRSVQLHHEKARQAPTVSSAASTSRKVNSMVASSRQRG